MVRPPRHFAASLCAVAVRETWPSDRPTKKVWFFAEVLSLTTQDRSQYLQYPFT